MRQSTSLCFSRVLVLLAVPMLLCTQSFAYGNEKPNFTGNWQLDSARSPDADGAAISLKITDSSGKLTFERSVKERGGKEVLSRFACSTTDNQCEFNENGHKAKVSFWYDGNKLVILKTDGPKEDATVERTLSLSPDGNTLTVQFANLDLDKEGKAKTLVFSKQPAAQQAVTR
jgi:hypothetical protein